MTVKVTEQIMERHMSKVDFLQGRDLSSLDPKTLCELATKAREDRLKAMKAVFENDPVYENFAYNVSSAAVESIKMSLIATLTKGGGMKDVESLIGFIMADALVFSYNILQDSISESWWERQVNKIEEKPEEI